MENGIVEQSFINLTHSCRTEISLRVELLKLRKKFASKCHHVLGLHRPPRESFNRWLQDVYSIADQQGQRSFTGKVLTEGPRRFVFPPFLDEHTISTRSIHCKDLENRIINRGVGTSLFWELMDELFSRITFPRTSEGMSRLIKIAKFQLTIPQHRKHLWTASFPTTDSDKNETTSVSWESCYRSKRRRGEDRTSTTSELVSPNKVQKRHGVQPNYLEKNNSDLVVEKTQCGAHCNTDREEGRTELVFSDVDYDDLKLIEETLDSVAWELAERLSEYRSRSGTFITETSNNILFKGLYKDDELEEKLNRISTWSSLVIGSGNHSPSMQVHQSSSRLPQAVQLLIQYGLIRSRKGSFYILTNQHNQPNSNSCANESSSGPPKYQNNKTHSFPTANCGNNDTIDSNISNMYYVIDIVALSQALKELRRPLGVCLYSSQVLNVLQTLEYLWHLKSRLSSKREETTDLSNKISIIYPSFLEDLLLNEIQGCQCNLTTLYSQNASHSVLGTCRFIESEVQLFVGLDKNFKNIEFNYDRPQSSNNAEIESKECSDSDIEVQFKVTVPLKDLESLWKLFCRTFDGISHICTIKKAGCSTGNLDYDKKNESGKISKSLMENIFCTSCCHKRLSSAIDLTTESLSCFKKRSSCCSLYCSFLHHVVNLIIRYDLLCGPDVMGGRGLHAGIPRAVLDVFNNFFKNMLTFECFASPFNAQLKNYFSLYYDTDQYFGSCGSFFNPSLTLLNGIYQLNPPFVEPVMERMAYRLIHWLQESERPTRNKSIKQPILDNFESNSSQQETDNYNLNDPKEVPGSLTFCVFVPDWDNGSECTFLNLLLNKTYQLGYLSGYLRVDPYQHQYNSYQTCQGLVEVLKNKEIKYDEIEHCQMPQGEEPKCSKGRMKNYYQRNNSFNTRNESSHPHNPVYQLLSSTVNAVNREASQSSKIYSDKIQTGRREFPGDVFLTQESSTRPSNVFFNSITSSLLIILQNKQGKTEWPITNPFFQEVNKAWKANSSKE